jgi:hypothetical protein
VCTTDTCNPASGCVFTNNTNPCGDGNVCNGSEVCAGGGCQPGTPPNCDDGNECTDDLCDALSGCSHSNNTAPCGGNECQGAGTCSGGTCSGGQLLTCDDLNECTDDDCQPGLGCVYTPNTAPCSDGDVCTALDTCENGVCVAGTDFIDLQSARVYIGFKPGVDNDKLSMRAEFDLDQLSGMPSDTGMEIFIVDGAQNTIYNSQIPAESFDNKQNKRFRFKDKEHDVKVANGLDKAIVSFSATRNQAKVKAKLKGVDLPAAEGQSIVTLSLLFGDAETGDCMTGLQMECSVTSSRVSCSMP